MVRVVVSFFSIISIVVGFDVDTPIVELESTSMLQYQAASTGDLRGGTCSNEQPQCAASWDRFRVQQPLNSSQLIHPWYRSVPHDFVGFNHAPAAVTLSDTSGLFVFPESQFAICSIAKSGSSLWGDVLLKVATNNLSAHGQQLWASLAPHHRGTPNEKIRTFSNPKATRAVFVREPLERFASAFLEGCSSMPLSESFCPMMVGLQENETVTMARAVEWALASNLLEVNEIWAPQSAMCELHKRIHEYTFVGFYRPETHSRDAACLMEVAGIGQYNSKGPEFHNAPFFTIDGRPDTSLCTPPNLFHYNTTADEHSMLQKLFTKEAALRLVRHYYSDYTTFHFPKEPEWISGATGELYNVALSAYQTVGVDVPSKSEVVG